jgi:hypothetical protein
LIAKAISMLSYRVGRNVVEPKDLRPSANSSSQGDWQEN